jgi:Mg2+ and Co2+ transporter CorA
VSYGEHNELKAYVAEQYIKRSEIKTHLKDLHQQLQSMQQQLNLMQQALYSALNK